MRGGINTEEVYRDFDVVKRGFMKYEPVYMAYDNGVVRMFKTHIYFRTRHTAMRVSMLMRTSYNDGLWGGGTHILLPEYE